MRYAVIIPAAGSGSRMGARVPKVLLPCVRGFGDQEVSILRRTVSVFAQDSDCARVVVCAPSEWGEDFARQLEGIPSARIVNGGSTRQESVCNGMEALIREGGFEDDSIVLVHDAARCCITSEVIKRVVDGVVKHGAVTAAVPIVDSLCRAEAGSVAGYLDRANAWSVQTPQGSFLKDLREAHRQARAQNFEGLDDASLVARLRPVGIVEGDRLNIKVTQPGDLEIAQLVIRGRGA